MLFLLVQFLEAAVARLRRFALARPEGGHFFRLQQRVVQRLARLPVAARQEAPRAFKKEGEQRECADVLLLFAPAVPALW